MQTVSSESKVEINQSLDTNWRKQKQRRIKKMNSKLKIWLNALLKQANQSEWSCTDNRRATTNINTNIKFEFNANSINI